MAALTLLEAAKRMQGTEIEKAVVEIYAASSPILRVLPFKNIAGNALKYNVEAGLPSVGFRAVNQAFSSSVGVLNPVTEGLAIAGGDIIIDPFILKTEGQGERAVQESMKIKSLSEAWTRAFLKGDSSVTPAELDGLQKRVTGSQLLVAGTTSGGDPLTLEKLDELIDRVMPENRYLIMNQSLRRRISTAKRKGVDMTLQTTKDEFGRQVTMYNDIPILDIVDAAGDDTMLPFTEAAPTGGQLQTTSVYCVSLGDGRLVGIQNGTIQTRDVGESTTTPAVITRIEWYAGMAIYHGRSVARLSGITNAAVPTT